MNVWLKALRTLCCKMPQTRILRSLERTPTRLGRFQVDTAKKWSQYTKAFTVSECHLVHVTGDLVVYWSYLTVFLLLLLFVFIFFSFFCKKAYTLLHCFMLDLLLNV